MASKPPALAGAYTYKNNAEYAVVALETKDGENFSVRLERACGDARIYSIPKYVGLLMRDYAEKKMKEQLAETRKVLGIE